MPDPGQLQVGQLFAGRYRVARLLRTGGMGAVYEATHEATRRRIALKIMRTEIVADADARARFALEAQVATIIESPNVVDVLDAGVDGPTGMPFLVMEFLVGEEVGEMIRRRRRLTPAEAVAILGATARALDRAHARSCTAISNPRTCSSSHGRASRQP